MPAFPPTITEFSSHAHVSLFFVLLFLKFSIYFSSAKESRHEISSNVVCATSKAYAQSVQSLCWSLGYSINIKLLAEQHLEFLHLEGGCTCSSEYTFVKMPHVVAQML